MPVIQIDLAQIDLWMYPNFATKQDLYFVSPHAPKWIIWGEGETMAWESFKCVNARSSTHHLHLGGVGGKSAVVRPRRTNVSCQLAIKLLNRMLIWGESQSGFRSVSSVSACSSNVCYAGSLSRCSFSNRPLTMCTFAVTWWLMSVTENGAYSIKKYFYLVADPRILLRNIVIHSHQ